MTRLNQEVEVLFEVGEHKVYANVDGRNIRIPGKKAIVNMKDHRVVGVVSAGYKLFTNKQAIDAARKCCQEVFPETRTAEWQVGRVDAPSTGGYCHIDLVHNTSALDFEYLMEGTRPDVPEAFGPFIRVTNSYNGSRALAFSIGFFRKICENGLVAPDVIIRFQFHHTRDVLGKGIKFNVERGRLGEMKRNFLDCFNALRCCKIEQSLFKPLILGVFHLRAPKAILDLSQWEAHRNYDQLRKAEEWFRLGSKVEDLSKKYVKEQGENAYGVLNSITDLASHPPVNRFIRRDRHSLQKMAGEWLISFSRQIQQPSFSVKDYLADLGAGRESN